jgi:hypothetical protein
MSMFEDSHYRWRETYFVMFRSSHRPKLKKVQQALSTLNAHYQLINVRGDSQGRVDSLTLISPDDFAALDICYTDGAEVLEQGAALAQDLQPTVAEAGNEEVLSQLVQCDARFDVLHFEQVPEFPEEDEPDEMLDPSALLLVLSALAKLTDGIAIDPQAGAVLDSND